MIRLSGSLSERPSPGAAIGVRYYATDDQTIYFSTGSSWVANWPLDAIDLTGIYGGRPLTGRPVPGSCVGWGFIDSDTGDQYEAFPDAWATVVIGGHGGGGGGGPSFLVNEGFEGVGAPPSWTPYNQPPDWDYSVSPLSGLQSLRMSSGISSGNNYQGLGYPTYPQGPDYGTVLNHDELWFKFKLKLETMNTGGVFNFQVYSQDELSAMSFMLHTTGEFGIQDPNGDTGYESLAQTTDQMSVGVIYDVFLHVKTNDAGDASAEVSFTETGGIRPTSGPRYASASAGLNVVAPLTEFWIYPTWGAIVLIDDFQVAASVID